MPKKRTIPIAYDPEGPQEIEILTIAERVCLRPRMHTSDGSLAQILALFAGYDMAGKMEPSLKDQSPSQALRWLAEICSCGECEPPSLQFEKILHHFGTETNTLNVLASFLKAQRTAAEEGYHTTPK